MVQECAAGDLFFASEEDAADKLGAAQRQQDGALEALQECRKNVGWCLQRIDCRALREAAWFNVKEADRRHSERKRKVDEAHKKTFLQKDCIRRATSDHVKVEGELNNSVGVSGHSRQRDGQLPFTRLPAASLIEEATKQSTCVRPQELIEEWPKAASTDIP